MTKIAIEITIVPRPCTRSTPSRLAQNTVATVTISPMSRRTGTNSSTGSSRYGPRPPARPLRSAISRSDSRIRALKAASIVPT